MAYMDTIERDQAAAESLPTQFQHQVQHGQQPGQPGQESSVVHALNSSTNHQPSLFPFPSVLPLSTAPVVSSAPVNYQTGMVSPHGITNKPKTKLSRLGGPSPEKGSGQDRFRRMMKDAPRPSTPHPNTAIAPGLSRVSAPSYLSYSPPAFTMRPGPLENCPLPTTIPGLGLHTETHPTASPTSKTEGPGPPSKIEAIPSIMAPAAPAASAAPARPVVDRKWTEDGKTYTALLSAECQKQHFNPSFTETFGNRGFSCSVNIQGTTLHSRYFKSASEAKQHVSKRALAEVRKWRGSFRPTPIVETGTRADDEDLCNGNSGWKPTPQNGYSQGVSRGNRGGSARSSASVSRGSDISGANSFGHHMMKNMIIQQIKDLDGLEGLPDERVLSDPLLSRVFLEGYALGRQHQSDRLKAQGDRNQRRSRSRSPGNGHSRPRRERSPRMLSFRP